MLACRWDNNFIFIASGNILIHLQSHILRFQDGFDFAGFKSVSMLNGSMVNAEVWTDSARLQPPAGITIYISPVTGEDVHYKDGGAFQLEWVRTRFRDWENWVSFFTWSRWLPAFSPPFSRLRNARFDRKTPSASSSPPTKGATNPAGQRL